MESIKLILGANLHELRKERGLTQAQLASMVGFEVQSYHKWENSKSWPELDAIVALAKALQVSESRLFLDLSIISPKIAIKVLESTIDKLSLN